VFYEPKKGHSLPHNPFAALVFPRPIGWISSLSKKGIANLAPYSFFNAIAYEPPQVMFAAPDYHSNGGIKDSVANILATKEFVVNLATKKLQQSVVYSSIDAPHGVDEFKLMKLKKRKSTMVQPPSVAESPATLECKLIKKIVLKAKKNNQNIMIMGEVIGIHIKGKFITKGKVNSLAMQAISRMGYTEYSEVKSRFFMDRPEYSGK
jgi:flavin reductase (DIM6/NTAB) family NADH-FMN oxidoreductase RutF